MERISYGRKRPDRTRRVVDLTGGLEVAMYSMRHWRLPDATGRTLVDILSGRPTIRPYPQKPRQIRQYVLIFPIAISKLRGYMLHSVSTRLHLDF